MAENPEISVLINVRNGLPYLGQAVSSMLGQTFSDFEIIVVNDGSDDGTAAWLDTQEAAEPRLKVLHLPPSGIPVALNAGLAIARGRLIAKMDADDISLPHRLERQAAVFRENPNLVLLGSEVEMIDETGMPLGTRGHPADHAAIRQQLLQGQGGALTHPAVMFRRDAAMAIGGYDPAFPVGQDLDLFLRLTDTGKALNLPEVLLHWRQHGTSVNRTKYDQWRDLKRRAIENTIGRIGPRRYVEELFPSTSPAPFPVTKQGIAKRAIRRQRLGTAASYGKRMLLEPSERLLGAKVLGKVALKWMKSKVRHPR